MTKYKNDYQYHYTKHCFLHSKKESVQDVVNYYQIPLIISYLLNGRFSYLNTFFMLEIAYDKNEVFFKVIFNFMRKDEVCCQYYFDSVDILEKCKELKIKANKLFKIRDNCLTLDKSGINILLRQATNTDIEKALEFAKLQIYLTKYIHNKISCLSFQFKMLNNNIIVDLDCNQKDLKRAEKYFSYFGINFVCTDYSNTYNLYSISDIESLKILLRLHGYL